MRLVGAWQPGGFPPWITLAGKLVLLTLMVTRGGDYLAGDAPDTSRRLSSIEAAAPLWAWGAVLLAAGLIGFCSMLLRRGGVLVWVHVVGAAVYAALAVGIVMDVQDRTVTGGWALAAAVILSTGLLVVAASRHLSRWEHTTTILAGAMIAAGLAAATVELDGLRSATILAGIGALHALMATGTASRLRQEQIIAHQEV